MKPRAYTEEELRDMLLDHIRNLAAYWARVGTSNLHIAEGVAFSILAALDGDSLQLPAFDLVARPCEEDKEFNISEGDNWIEDGTTLSTTLHEFFHKKDNGE